MRGALVCDRPVDLPLALVGGGSTNLGHFCGQKLAIFFCPANPASAAREVEAYRALADEFGRAGVWLVGVVAPPFGADVAGSAPHINLAIDADGSALSKLAGSLPGDARDAAAEGATFLMDRDGSVRSAWAGSGHAIEALAAAKERP